MVINNINEGRVLRIAAGILALILLVGGASATTSPIGFGETKSANISTPSEMDAFTFTANAGDNVLIRLNAEWSAYPEIKLYAPNGSLIISSYSGGFFVEIEKKLPVAGIYTILVGDRFGAKKGNYTIYLQKTNNPVNAISIGFGDTKFAKISSTSEMDAFKFTANAGDIVLTRMNAEWSAYPEINLYAPNGSLIISSYSGGSFVEIEKKLLVAGIYTIFVGDRFGAKKGNYTIYLQRTNNPINAKSIGFGDNKFDKISITSEMDAFKFTACTGEQILIRLNAKWSAYPEINLYAPNGSLIISSYSGGSFVEIEKNLPVAGIYTILVGDYYGAKKGNYTLYLESINRLSCIMVTSPNGGENWQAGTNKSINWIYSGTPGSYVKLELLKGGISNSIIKSSTTISNGSYNWTIPETQLSGTYYKVRIMSTTYTAYNDSSDRNFTISNPTIGITVTSPNGGENWKVGTKQVIKWIYSASPGTYVKIELLKGGVFNRNITSNTSTGSGSYNFTINLTQTPGNDYKVEITSLSNPKYNDSSNANFSISALLPICNISNIYGYSFNDTNGNKTKDIGEVGLSTRTINLKGYDTCTRTLVSKIIKTNATGYFAFKSINPGSYMLSEDYILGWLPTTDAAYTLSIPSVSVTIRKDFGNKKFI